MSVTLTTLHDVVKNFQLSNYKSNDIFLFMFAIDTKENGIIPLAQAMTENTTLQFIVEFVLKYLKVVEHRPHKIIVGYSISMLNGISWALNTCYLNEYIDKYFQYIMKRSFDEPITFIYI